MRTYDDRRVDHFRDAPPAGCHARGETHGLLHAARVGHVLACNSRKQVLVVRTDVRMMGIPREMLTVPSKSKSFMGMWPDRDTWRPPGRRLHARCLEEDGIAGVGPGAIDAFGTAGEHRGNDEASVFVAEQADARRHGDSGRTRRCVAGRSRATAWLHGRVRWCGRCVRWRAGRPRAGPAWVVTWTVEGARWPAACAFGRAAQLRDVLGGLKTGGRRG